MSALRRGASDEQGFVMVLTMVVLMIALIVAGVAISQTVTARGFTDKDRRIDQAQQAADSGLQVALYRANQMDLGQTDFNSGLTGLSSSLSCLVPVSVSGYVSALSTVTLGANAACPSTPDPDDITWQYERLGNHTSFAYKFIPGATSTGNASTGHATLNPVIVSIGRDDRGTASASDDIVRRIEAILNPVDPFNMIESTGNLTFGAASTIINGDARTNGKLTTGLTLVAANVLAADGSLLRPANLQYGTSYHPGLLTTATAVRTTSSFTREPVTISASKPDCWTGSGPQGTAGPCPAAAYYDPTYHTLKVESGETVTLAPGDYVFCDVTVEAAGLLSSAGMLSTSATAASPTRIFIDSPSSARCSGVSGTSTPLSLMGKLNTVTTTPSALQIYVAGNGNPGGTTATIDTSPLAAITPAFFLYAPDTDVSMKVLTFQGNVIGHDVTFSGGAVASVLTQDLGLSNLPLSSSVGLFTRKQYVQCTGVEPPAATPTANC